MADAIRLTDFFPKKSSQTSPQSILSVPVQQIKPSPNQSRMHYYSADLEELVQSVKEMGVLQPVTVRAMGENQYELVCGDRRLRAAKLAGLAEIPALVLEANDGKSAMVSLTENLQRRNLHFFEEASAFQSIIKEYGFTQEEAAKKMGRSQSSIANKLRLLRLNDEVKRLIMEHQLTERHARAFLRIPDPEALMQVVNQVIVDELNVKKTEELVSETLSALRDKLVQSHDQKIKGSLGDIRLITNTVRQTVAVIRQAGITAEYELEEQADRCEVKIHILL